MYISIIYWVCEILVKFCSVNVRLTEKLPLLQSILVLEASNHRLSFSLRRNLSAAERLRVALSEGGMAALYRGLLPGTIRSFLANGAAMVMMQWAQRQVTARGLR